jgi:hypothetical protein
MAGAVTSRRANAADAARMVRTSREVRKVSVMERVPLLLRWRETAVRSISFGRESRPAADAIRRLIPTNIDTGSRASGIVFGVEGRNGS